MTGLRLFLAGRGVDRRWLATLLTVVVVAAALTWMRAGVWISAAMIQDDETQLATSLAVLVVSGLCALPMRADVPWREHLARRPLRRERALLVLGMWGVLVWPLVSLSELGLQHVAVGLGLFGCSCLVAPLRAVPLALPQVIVLLLGLVPELVSPSWHPFMPAQRSALCSWVCLGVAAAGAVVGVASASAPHRLRSAPRTRLS
ncbi:hypothetical protein [uncultured Tessaracoccus sp.]|uniref:hypothetical protein n=1 Tax=uncultured Tessaracoccus sp. TaxID=905023 RepID=UPI0025FD7BA6|nr:hypothetical protein [uncultured Tessaracoccus sp.]